MRPTPTAALLACIVSSFPLAARAADTMGVLAASPPPGPTPALVDLSGQLRSALASRAPGFLEPLDLRARMGDLAPASSLEETDRSYEAARAAELSGDPLRAVAGLEAVIKELEGLPESPAAFAQWSRAMLRLAKVESLLSGHEAKVGALLEQLLRADPEIKVEPDVQGAEVAELAAAVRKRLASLPRRRLIVAAPSSGVSIFLNGRPLGPSAGSPVSLLLPAGMYKVAAREGDLRLPPFPVDLTAKDQEVALDFSIARLLRPAQGPGLAADPRDTGSIFRAAGYLHLDTVVVTHLLETDSTTYLVGSSYDVTMGRLRVSGVMHLTNLTPPAGGMNSLADYLLTGKKMKGPVREYDPARNDWKVEKSKAKGWIAFGSGVATVALTGASLYYLNASNKANHDANGLLLPGNVLPPDRSQYDSYRRKSRNAKQAATVSALGAGVCLASTVVFGIISYKQTGEIGPIRF